MAKSIWKYLFAPVTIVPRSVGGHVHLCFYCVTQWVHIEEFIAGLTKDQFERSHMCPKCGAYIYTKDTPINRILVLPDLIKKGDRDGQILWNAW